MDDDRLKLLGIYLQDHLAGSVTGIELAKRILSENQDNDFGRVIGRLATEIEQDRQALIRLMSRLGVQRNLVKEAMAWVMEKAGRLKLNGQITGYSPLSRFIELEGLTLGVTGKLALWRALDRVADVDERIDRGEIRELMERAERQREELERERLRAAELAFRGGIVSQGATEQKPRARRAPARAT